jgi:hypothetical protein
LGRGGINEKFLQIFAKRVRGTLIDIGMGERIILKQFFHKEGVIYPRLRPSVHQTITLTACFLLCSQGFIQPVYKFSAVMELGGSYSTHKSPTINPIPNQMNRIYISTM